MICRLSIMAALAFVPAQAMGQSVTCYRLGPVVRCDQSPSIAQQSYEPTDFRSALGALPKTSRAVCIARAQRMLNQGMVDEARTQATICAGM